MQVSRRSLAMVALVAATLIPLTHAVAGVPNPPTALAPDWIHIVGTQNGVPHPDKAVTVIVWDSYGVPVPGVMILFDFSSMPDVRLCGAYVEGVGRIGCTDGRVFAPTDAQGQLTLTFLGAGVNTGGSPGHGLRAGEIYGDGIFLTSFTATLLDQDGAVNGTAVNGADLSLAAADVNTYALLHTYRGRSDFSEDEVLSGVDLSFMAADVLASQLGHGSASGCAAADGPRPFCP